MVFNSDLNDYFTIILTIIVTLNGIAIPLSYNIISENLKPFLDKNVSSFFLKEKSFRHNTIISIWALPIFSFPLLVDIRTMLNVGKDNRISLAFSNLYVLFTFFFIAGFLLRFISFSRTIYEYASNTEEIVFEKLKKEIDEFIDGN